MSSLRCLAQRNEVINHVGIVRMSPWLNGKVSCLFIVAARKTNYGAWTKVLSWPPPRVGQHAAAAADSL